jgi:dihydroorotate dehydrogenase electron transfer subunit
MVTDAHYTFEELMLRRTSIMNVIVEAPGIKTFWLAGAIPAAPGQFVMLWIPEVGARPFSVYRVTNDSFALTIASVGYFTQALFNLPCGSPLGYFGPFGRPFVSRGQHPALVGGGYGAAPLLFLAQRHAQTWCRIEFIVGSRTASLLLYRDEPSILGRLVRHDCTDDGSFGYCGSAAERLRLLLLEDPTIDMVYTVGPERMMAAVVDVCERASVDYQISLERYMKCGYGLCGACCVDPIGIRMCVEGPVLDRETVRSISEFGVYHRDETGTKIHFEP